MSKATVEMTALEKDGLCGGHWEDRYPIPSESAFDAKGIGRLESPDLAAMAERLIALDRLKIGHLARFRLRVMWMKSGGNAGGKPRWGSVAIATPDDKLFTGEDGQPIDAKVRLAADNLREAEATYWEVANQLCFQLKRIGIYTTQEGGVERLMLIGPDASFFTEQLEVFGPQTPELKRAIFDIRQTRFEWADRLADDIAKAEAAKDHDPAVAQAPGVEAEPGPVPDGAPDAEWAEPFKGDPDMMELIEAGLIVAEDDEPNDDTHDPETGEARLARIKAEQAAHEATIRERFGTETVEGIEVCRRCGIAVAAHNAEVCEGGSPETRARKISRKSPKNRSGANGAGSKGLDLSGENPATGAYSVPGDISSNGAHDDAIGPLFSPSRVVATLSERGLQIEYSGGEYRHPSGLPIYSTEYVEGEMRSAMAGKR